MIHLLASDWFGRSRPRRLCRSHLCLFPARLVSRHRRAHLYRRSVFFRPDRLFLLARLLRRGPLRAPCRRRAGVGRGIPAIFAAGPGSVVVVFVPARSPQARVPGNGRAGHGSAGLAPPHALCERRDRRLCFEPLVAVAAGSGPANRLHFLGIHFAGARWFDRRDLRAVFGPAALLPLRGSKLAETHGAHPDVHLDLALAGIVVVHLRLPEVRQQRISPGLVPPACVWLGFWAADWYRRFAAPENRPDRFCWPPPRRSTVRSSSALLCTSLIGRCSAPSTS